MIQLRDYLSTDKGSTIHGNGIGFINKNCLDYLGTSFFTNIERMSAFMQPGDKDQNRYPGAALFVMYGEMKDSSTLEYSDRGTYWTFILNVSLQMDPKGIAPVFTALSKYCNQKFEGLRLGTGNSSVLMCKSYCNL
jgi:hypothetical protein